MASRRGENSGPFGPFKSHMTCVTCVTNVVIWKFKVICSICKKSKVFFIHFQRKLRSFGTRPFKWHHKYVISRGICLIWLVLFTRYTWYVRNLDLLPHVIALLFMRWCTRLTYDNCDKYGSQFVNQFLFQNPCYFWMQFKVHMSQTSHMFQTLKASSSYEFSQITLTLVKHVTEILTFVT